MQSSQSNYRKPTSFTVGLLAISCIQGIFFFGAEFNTPLLAQEIEASATAIERNEQGIDPNQIVLESVKNSLWGPPFACAIRQKSELGDKKTLALGEYWHAGQGSGQFKSSMRISVNESVTNVIQSCDGRLMRTYLGVSQPLRSLNLDRIRQALGPFRPDQSTNPETTLYLAVGGQPEVLRMLYNRYRWVKAYAGTIENEPVWQLIGRVRTEPPAVRASAQVDAEAYLPNPAALVPTDVRLTLGRNEDLPLFPYRIEYFHEVEDDKGNKSLRHFSTIEYHNVNSPIEVKPEMFRYSGIDETDRLLDETKIYMPPVDLASQRDQLSR